MRKIKFRIRNLKESCVDHVWGDPDNIFIRASDGKAFCFDGFANALLEYDDLENISIEQYIGLKDSTKWEDLTEKERENWTRSGKLPSEWEGKKIYEGDIDEYGYVIKYNEEKALYAEHSIDRGSIMSYPIDNSCIKIIGNIHENKDLIKE